MINMIGQLIGIYAIVIILVTLFALSFPYTMFGLKLMWKNMSTKKNVGLIFIRNMADNYALPHVIDLRNTEYKFKVNGQEYTYIIKREHFAGFKFLGLPTAYFDSNNMVTSIGLHSHAMDKEGVPLYHEDGEPVITLEKPSVSMHPSLIKAILGSTALTKAIEEIFQKHKIQIYILGGIGIGIAGSVYLMYEMKYVDVPILMNEFESIKEICTTLAQERVVING
jgi:hypothetical protein